MEYICGIDEAGRGPLAGPVTAGAVILPSDFPKEILADSKKMSPAKRERAFVLITQRAIWSVGWASPEEIDAINILKASHLAMVRALESLPFPPDLVLIDGPYTIATGIPSEAIIKGDSLVFEIMAASIVAKVTRDAWMTRYAREDPRYGFEKHMGYPTKLHYERLSQYGACEIHRKSFRLTSPFA